MSNPNHAQSPHSELINIYQTFLGALLDTAVFHGGMLVLASGRGTENPWLKGDLRKSFLKVGFEAHFVYRMAVLDSLLNSLTSLVLCYRPGDAVGDREFKVGRLISKSRAQILTDFIDARVKHLSRESFVARIRVLQSILKCDFGIEEDEYNKLKTASAVRNKIVHEGSSFAFKLNDDMSVSRKEDQPDRIASKEWAYFQFIEPLAIKILVKVAETLFGSDGAELMNKRLHDHHPDGSLGRHSGYAEIHETYDMLISRAHIDNGNETAVKAETE